MRYDRQIVPASSHGHLGDLFGAQAAIGIVRDNNSLAARARKSRNDVDSRLVNPHVEVMAGRECEGIHMTLPSADAAHHGLAAFQDA